MSILNPSVEVEISSGKVAVRQLPFLRAIEFVEKIGAVAGKYVTKDGQFKLAMKITTKPERPVRTSSHQGEEEEQLEEKLELDLSELQKLISESGELMSFLILHSTKKDQAWLEELSLAEGMVILKAAIEQNLSAEVMRLGNEMAGSILKSFGPATKKPLSKPSSS